MQPDIHHDEIERVGLTADEKLWVMQSAAARGLSRSSYIRSLILAERLRSSQQELWRIDSGNISPKAVPIRKG